MTTTPVSPGQAASPRGAAAHSAKDLRRSKSGQSATSEMHRRAHRVRSSFTRPRSWVLIFGWSLALCAGMVNVVAFRAWDLYVSHMTGDTTAIGMRLEGVHQRDTQFYTLRDAIVLLVSFIIGAFACGILIDKNQVHFGGKSFYGFALVAESALLCAATFTRTDIVAACFASCACGLQNAMCTSHFGAVVRTTHVTGTVTDIGSTLGRITMIFLRKGCRRQRLNVVERAEVGVDARKLMVLAGLWTNYLLGTILGAYLYTLCHVTALLFPACFTGIVGLFYMVFRQRLKSYLKEVEQERLNKDLRHMRGSLERAQVYLRQLHQTREGRANGEAGDDDDESVVIELEEGVEDMLERMRDLEEGIETMYSSPRSHHSSRNVDRHHLQGPNAAPSTVV